MQHPATFRQTRKSKSQAAAQAQALTLVKDALGMFSILAMLYVGLFIPVL